MNAHKDVLHDGGPTKDALFDFVAGRLHPDAAEWIRVHIRTCPRCTEATEDLAAVRSALTVPEVSPFIRQRDLNAVRRRLAEPRKVGSRRAAFAGLSLAALGGAALALVLTLHSWTPVATPLAAKAVRPLAGAPWTVTLRQGAADVEIGDEHVVAQAHQRVQEGAALVVQPGSRIAAEWGGARVALEGVLRGARARLESSQVDTRVLRLERGRVVLDVDPLAPGATLAVVTPDARVTVHGTIFMVDASPAGTRVAVERGVVRVERRGRSVDVIAGQSLAADAEVPVKLDDEARRSLEAVPRGQTAPTDESLDVFADIAGAQVAIDGVDVGAAPVSLALSSGSHRVRVSAPGRLPVEERLEVTAGTPALFNADLVEPLAAPTTAPHSPHALRTAPDELQRARAEVLEGSYGKAIARLEALSRRSLASTEAARAALLEAEAFRLDRRPERAVPLFERVSKGSGPEAEQGQFLLGQTLARDLLDPRRAAHVWAESQRRFPQGIFREESAYRLGESLLAAGETREGVAALERYLATLPGAAHAEEAHLLVAAARRDRLGDCPGALPHLHAVGSGRGPRSEQAMVGEARCLRSLGRTGEARAAYQRYLQRAPHGRFADEARDGTR